MTVSYLDVDDEITDAIARLRQADGGRFILVLPPGSRVATSRINFRLLAREGQERSITVALVSGDAGVRSLAISAGMPAYGSVQEAEASLPVDREPVAHPQPPPARISTDTTATPVEPMAEEARRAVAGPTGQPREAVPRASTGATAPAPGAAGPPVQPRVAPTAIRSGGPVRAGADLAGRADQDGTRILPRSSVSGVASHGRTPVTATPPQGWEGQGWYDGAAAPARARARGRGLGLGSLIVRVGVLFALLGGAAYVAYLTLPNVSIIVEPRSEPAGPITVEIVADRSAAVADPEAGVVPAEVVDIPLSATDDFPATGIRIDEIRATGRVVLTSENTVADVVVAQGTRISTASGVLFETVEIVTVPQADFDAQAPGRADVRVRALRAGPSGNVPAGTITRLPAVYADQRVEATNPNATSGGERREVAVITRDDFDEAVAALERRLEDQLELAVEDPNLAPSGLVTYRETAAREPVTTDPTGGALIDQAMETFTLTAESIGTVLAVDEVVVSDMAADRLAASVPPDARLFADSVRADLGSAEVTEDGRVAYTATVTGEQYVPPDQAELVAAIRGRSIDQARVILEGYGTVRITPWPDFVGSVPDDPRRINLTILDPQRSGS